MKAQPQCFILTPMPDVDSAIAYLQAERPERMIRDGDQKKSVDLQLRFDTGAKIDASFPNKLEAIYYLKTFA